MAARDLFSVGWVAVIGALALSCAAGDQDSENTFGPGLGSNAGKGTGQTSGDDGGDDDGGDDDGDGTPSTDAASETAGGDTPDPTTPGDDNGTSDAGGACEDDVDCDDGDACTIDVCGDLGNCQASAVDCSDGVNCTADTCDPTTGCAHAPDASVCDNANACDGAETCDAVAGCQAGLAINCDDGNACTADSCNPVDGMCVASEVVACNAGDGCCPLGCSANIDSDCVCTNSGGAATGSNSAGGNNGAGYGPANWTDGVDEAACAAANCFECYGWVTNDASPGGGEFMQLTWPATQTIGSMVVDTTAPGAACSPTQNRNIEDGTVQYWNGASWVNAATFSNQLGDLTFNFNPPLQTTRVRLFDVTTTPGGINSLMFEWYVYEPLDCSP